MTMSLSTLLTKVIGDKKRWRRYRSRKEQLPPGYRALLEAVQRYTYYRGPATADASSSLLEDLLEVVEEAAANGTPIADLVGDDPVEFAEGFIRNYSESEWITKERRRLTEAVERAAAQDVGPEGRAAR
jgi:DNA-binding ferritin-like protein (Dps family)